MKIDELLKKGKEAFHRMDWKEVERVNKEILGKGPDERTKNLATGFYHYAISKMGDKHDKIILNLKNARSSFEKVDSELAAMAETERLILLSEFDKDNRGHHLVALGDFTRDIFMRTNDPSQLQLAIRAYEDARSYFKGDELERINQNLIYCYGNYAPYSKKPKEAYEKLIKLSEDIEKLFKSSEAKLGWIKMNHAIAYQHLASIEDADVPEEDIKEAIKLNEEAIALFENAGSKPEVVRAKQSLVTMLEDASQIDVKNAGGYLKKSVQLRKEIGGLFLSDNYELEYACESLDCGLTCLELASVDEGGSREHLKEAVNMFEEAAKVFAKEKKGEDLGQAKMGIAVAYKNQCLFNEGIAVCEEAIRIFERENNTMLLGLAKQNLAETYRSMAEQDRKGENKYLAMAEKLEKEAEELLREEKMDY